MVQTSLFLHAARFRLRFLFGVWWTCSAGSGTGSGGSGGTPPTGGSALPSVVLVVPRDRELLLAFLHHFPALGVRDLVVVLPALGVRDLDGRTGGSGLDAAARSAALGVVREVLPSQHEAIFVQNAEIPLLDFFVTMNAAVGLPRKQVSVVFWTWGVPETFPRSLFYLKTCCETLILKNIANSHFTI